MITDSPPPPPPPPPSGGGCFPSSAKVKIETGKYVRMSELQIGDQVQAGRYTKVYANIISFLLKKIILMNWINEVNITYK